MTDPRSVDLNLLGVFEALYAERSVSRAARRLGVGQPAASQALGRLRELFGDELFVRTPAGMVPTARAEGVAGRVLGALAELRGALDEEVPFDPAASTRSFTVSGGDYAGLAVLPGLARRTRREAPGVRLRHRFVEKDAVVPGLDDGRLDVALGVFPSLPQHLAAERVLSERFVCLTDPGHAAVAGGLDLAAFLASPHLLVTERGDESGAVDTALRARGLERTIALTAPHVLLVPGLLRGTDLVATTGRRAARLFAERDGLALHEPPLELAPWELLMVWQRRRGSDGGLRWLLDALRGSARE